MRVLHYIWSTNFGGIEKLVLDLGRAQGSIQGHDVGILVGQDNGEFSEQFHRSFDCVASLNLKSGRDRSRARNNQALDVMQKHDLIHIHTFNPLVAAAAVRSNRPIVYTEHGNFGFGRKRTVADRLKAKILRRFLNRSVDHITFNSRFTSQESERRFGIKTVDRTVVYNGIDLGGPCDRAAISSEIAAQIQGKFVVGTTTRFAGFKRIDRLIDGFASIADDCDAILLLVGDGPLRSQLERQARQLGIESKVIFAGFQPNVGNYQAAMDVCVFPSENEPFGLVAIESLERSKPTIVFSDGGGLVEIVAPVAPEDVVNTCEELTARMRGYFCHQNTISENAEVRRQRAADFSIERMAQQMESVYQMSISNRENA